MFIYLFYLCHLHVRQLPENNQTIVPDEGTTRGLDALLAVGRQGDVGRARVAAV